MIQARGLTKHYGSVTAVRDLDLEIDDGQVVGFLGLNGAGKTTTLRMLAGDLAPSSGSISIDGHDLLAEPRVARRLVGFLPEDPPIYPEMTVGDFLAYVGGLRGLRGRELEDRVEEVARSVQVRDRLGQLLGTLSHGYRKRVGIAQAIVHRPRLVILDEPISGLDPVQIGEMRILIRALAGAHTVLISSHILPEISQTCDRLLVLGHGTIVADGAEDELGGRLAAPATGEHRIVLVVRAETAAVRTAIEPLEGILEVKLEPRAGNSVEVTVVTRGDRREDLARAVVQAGLGLLAMSRAQGELEEVFVQLTLGASAPSAPA